MTEDDARTATPKLRFPEFEDGPEWNGVTLCTIAKPVTQKAVAGDANIVLSLSGEHGIVRQSDYFGKQIADTNAERSIKIARDDFVYNDRTTKQNVYGTIKRLTAHESGVVSPIYKCFRFEIGETPAFWDFYFESGTHDGPLSELVNEGARAGRFNISISTFLSTAVWRPDHDEQQKIAACLTSLEEVIAGQSRKVEALQAHKKGLTRMLFPGPGKTLPQLRFQGFHKGSEWSE